MRSKNLRKRGFQRFPIVYTISGRRNGLYTVVFLQHYL